MIPPPPLLVHVVVEWPPIITYTIGYNKLERSASFNRFTWVIAMEIIPIRSIFFSRVDTSSSWGISNSKENINYLGR